MNGIVNYDTNLGQLTEDIDFCDSVALFRPTEREGEAELFLRLSQNGGATPPEHDIRMVFSPSIQRIKYNGYEAEDVRLSELPLSSKPVCVHITDVFYMDDVGCIAVSFESGFCLMGDCRAFFESLPCGTLDKLLRDNAPVGKRSRTACLSELALAYELGGADLLIAPRQNGRCELLIRLDSEHEKNRGLPYCCFGLELLPELSAFSVLSSSPYSENGSGLCPAKPSDVLFPNGYTRTFIRTVHINSDGALEASLGFGTLCIKDTEAKITELDTDEFSEAARSAQ